MSRELRLSVLRLAVDAVEGQAKTPDGVINFANAFLNWIAEAPETGKPKRQASKEQDDKGEAAPVP